MITALFLWLIYGFVRTISAPILWVPDVSLSSNIGDAITTAGGYLAPINFIFPVDVLISVFGIFLTYELLYGVYKITMWVVRRLPTQS